jgi:RimJ/RimL family protein N-acetyltransferase
MIKLEPFRQSDFNTLISWIDSEELLVTIAGTAFTYPLTINQLQNYLEDDRSMSFNIVDAPANKVIGHAEILLANDGTCKLDKLLIGDKSNRGKGIGEQVLKELLKYAFNTLAVHAVELNVFDWNLAGIRCYEKAGFAINPHKTSNFEVNGNNWVALNMIIHNPLPLSCNPIFI